MHIDWPLFTPWSAATGGAIIGGLAAAFVLINGRVAGGLLRPSRARERKRQC